MHSVRLVSLASLFVVAANVSAAQAQTFAFSLFEGYLDKLRESAGIPGLSAAVLQNGSAVWEKGLGKQDLEGNVPASLDTPWGTPQSTLMRTHF